MIVSGLNNNRFLTGNGIPVQITPDGGQTFATGTLVTMTISRLATHPGQEIYTLPPSKIYPGPNGVTLELSEIIRGLMPYPYVPTAAYQDPVPNYQNFTFTFEEDQTNTSEVFSNKTFVRGYRRTWTPTAQTLGATELLSPVGTIPFWDGFPIAVFQMDANTISPILVLPEGLGKRMRPPTACEPLYVRFMNSLGGYSFWMFNSWEWGLSSSPSGTIPATGETKSLGFDQENTITAHGRIKSEHYPLIRDLIASPVIQIYSTGEVPFSQPWTKVEAKQNSFNTSNYGDMQEVSFQFELDQKIHAQTTW